MLICDTTSSFRRVRWAKRAAVARDASAGVPTSPSVSAGSGRTLRRAADDNFRYRQMRITAEVAACDLDFHCGSIARADRNGFRQLPVGKCFVRRPRAQGATRAVGVVPIRKVIQPALDGRGAHSQQREPLPLLETFEESLHLAVQKRTSHPRVDRADSLPTHRITKLLPELAAVVRDDEFRSAMPGGGAAYQCVHFPCTRRFDINLQRQNLARESVKCGRDEKGEPQNSSRLRNKLTAHQEIRNRSENSLVAFLWRLVLRQPAMP